MAQLANLSIDELEAALQQKKQEHRAELAERHRELSSQLRELEKEMDEIDGVKSSRRAGGAGGARPKNKVKLREAIVAALKGDKKGKTKDEIAETVLKSGYRTDSADFPNIVYQTLHRNQAMFKRGADGRYTLAK